MQLNFEKIIWLIIGLILTLIMLVGCTAKKTTTTTEIKKDSLRTSNFEYVSKPIETTIYFPDLCDTITGKPRKFEQFESSGKNKARLSSFKSGILVNLETAESKTKIDTIIRYKYRDKVVEVDKVKYKTPLWMYLTIIFLTLINVILLRFTFFR